MIRSTFHLLRAVTCLAALGTFAFGQGDKTTPGLLPKKRVAFRNSNVDLKDAQRAGTIHNSETDQAKDLDGLNEQKRTLESEIIYAKAKLEAARKKLAIRSALGRPEEADVAEQEVKDWEARLKGARAQLAQIEEEIDASRQAPKEAVPGGDLIVPGENIEVFVVEDATFNGRYQVRRGGYIILPQVGRINVAGKSIEETERAVKKALESSQLRKASVMVEPIKGGDIESGPVIYLAGEFSSPRPFRVPRGVTPTLVGVILSSGGVTNKADLTRVRAMRVKDTKGVVEEVNVQRILDGAGPGSDITLDDGDIVVIPTGSASVVYLTGNVQRPGAVNIKLGEKINAYATILQNGGFKRFAKESGIYILRAMPDGTKQKIRVNVSDIKKGRSPDVPLQINDIVVVPEKFFSF